MPGISDRIKLCFWRWETTDIPVTRQYHIDQYWSYGHHTELQLI